MKPLNYYFPRIAAWLILFTALGCASLTGDSGTTSVHVTGPAGTRFTADYWQQGERVRVAATLPWDFENQHISKIEVQKANPGDILTVEAHYTDGKSQTMLTRTLPVGTRGLSIAVQHGLIMKTLSN